MKQLIDWGGVGGIWDRNKILFMQVKFTIGESPMLLIIASRKIMEVDSTNHAPVCYLPVVFLELLKWRLDILQGFYDIIEYIVPIAILS